LEEAMPDWSIKIVLNPNAVADAPGAFEPLQASLDDIVSWNDTTGQKHQPWPTDSSYKPLAVTEDSPLYLSDEIAPFGRSDAYDLIMPATVDPTTGIGTLYYYCKLHHGEHGTITVKPIPAVPPAPPPQD
jgi:hypothetical protein